MATLRDILPASKKPTLGKIIAHQTPFDATAKGVALNTLRGLPGAAFDVAKNIGQGILRETAAVGQQVLNAATLGKAGSTVQPATNETGKKLADILYGSNEPISLQSAGEEYPFVPKGSKAAPFIAVAGFASNFIGGEGNSVKTFLKEAARSRVPEEIAALATKRLGVPEDVAKALGERYKLVNDPKLIEEDLSQTLKTMAVEKAKTSPRPVLKEDAVPVINKEVQEATKKNTLINLERLNIGDEGAGKLLSTIEDIRPELEAVKGRPLAHAEVLKAAADSAILTKATSREATLKSEAALLATRQNLTAMAEGKGVSPDFIDQLRIVSAEATRRGRELNALGISADPIAKTTKGEIVKKLLDAGIEADKIVKASEGVDFTNLKEVTKFYREFIAPTKTEWLDEYRYINLLSSPRTHIINAFSNLIQGTVLNPATRLATGAVDMVMAGLTGRERVVYAKEVAPYFRGFLNAVPDASKSFLEAMKGNIVIDRPDLIKIPTGSKVLRPFQAIPRVLEASDVFFRTLITEGERQAIADRFVKQGKELNDTVLAQITEEAQKKAEYFVFRKALDPSNKTGQGALLSAIDKATSGIYQLRKVPGVKWFIPFVQTPMNILKQGIEYSPLGLATLAGATNKTEQLGKTMVGSVVFLGAASLGLQGRLTWSAPTSKKEKDAFYNSGRQPYSVKIGNSWVSFSKLGPLAYPIAMAAAIQWQFKENPKTSEENTTSKTVRALTGILGFFSDQSYMQGMKSLLDTFSGDARDLGFQSALTSSAGQLIPLASLQRWVAHLIDPVYRKPEAGFNLKNIIQSIQKDLPILSEGVPRIEGSLRRQNSILNSFSPVQITPVNKKYENKLQQIRREQRRDARLQAIKDRSSN